MLTGETEGIYIVAYRQAGGHALTPYQDFFIAETGSAGLSESLAGETGRVTTHTFPLDRSVVGATFDTS